MRVHVIPYAELRRTLLPDGGHDLWVELPERATVDDALRQLGAERIEHLIVGIDGEYATRETALRDGAELILVTPMEGG